MPSTIAKEVLTEEDMKERDLYAIFSAVEEDISGSGEDVEVEQLLEGDNFYGIYWGSLYSKLSVAVGDYDGDGARIKTDAVFVFDIMPMNGSNFRVRVNDYSQEYDSGQVEREISTSPEGGLVDLGEHREDIISYLEEAF